MTLEQTKTLLMVGNFLSGVGYSPSTCEALAARLSMVGQKVLTTSQKPGRLSRLLDMLWSSFSWRHNYDIAYVEVYSGLAFIWAEAVCWLLFCLGKPFVLSLHGGNLPSFAKRHPARVRRLFKMADVVVAPSGYLAEMGHDTGKNIQVIPNGIDVSPYHFHQRRNLKPKLVWLRAFDQIYNPLLAVQVLQELIGDFPDITLQMTGPAKSPWLENTQKLANDLGVAQKISFGGRIDKSDVPNYLNKGDIFINTTNIDNTPVCIIEAMACGLCVVSTDVGGIPFLLDHEVDGVVVPPDDPQAMAAAVKRLLNEPGLAHVISSHARGKAENFDWPEILPQWLQIFNQIVNERSQN